MAQGGPLQGPMSERTGSGGVAALHPRLLKMSPSGSGVGCGTNVTGRICVDRVPADALQVRQRDQRPETLQGRLDHHCHMAGIQS